MTSDTTPPKGVWFDIQSADEYNSMLRLIIDMVNSIILAGPMKTPVYKVCAEDVLKETIDRLSNVAHIIQDDEVMYIRTQKETTYEKSRYKEGSDTDISELDIGLQEDFR